MNRKFHPGAKIVLASRSSDDSGSMHRNLIAGVVAKSRFTFSGVPRETNMASVVERSYAGGATWLLEQSHNVPIQRP